MHPFWVNENNHTPWFEAAQASYGSCLPWAHLLYAFVAAYPDVDAELKKSFREKWLAKGIGRLRGGPAGADSRERGVGDIIARAARIPEQDFAEARAKPVHEPMGTAAVTSAAARFIEAAAPVVLAGFRATRRKDNPLSARILDGYRQRTGQELSPNDRRNNLPSWLERTKETR